MIVMNLRKHVLPVSILFVAGFAIVALHLALTRHEIENIATDYAQRSGSHAVAVPLPRELELAGERVPLNLFYVREALDRELTSNTYWHSNTLLMFKRAHRYFPVIEPILEKHGIPDDMKYLALVESGLTLATSPAGAGGFWQFIPETAKAYGLEISHWVDERNHLARSTEAACKYMRKAFKEHGNWTMVAASYNGGQGRMKRVVKHQGTNNFYELYLNAETSRYVYRLLAMKLIFEHPEKYGYDLKSEEMYPPIPVKTVTVTSSIGNLPQFARDHGISYRLLREMNPWLADSTLEVKPGKAYSFSIPVGRYDDYDALIREDLNQNPKPDTLQP